MSDTHDSGDDRAERAFRAAFERADALPPASVAVPGGVERSRNRWRLPAVAAAVLVLVVGSLALGSALRGDGEQDTADRAVGSLPEPRDGYRWVSWRDVAVQVPEGWGYGHEPGPDWCAHHGNGPARPASGFVALHSDLGGILAIGCPDPGERHDEEFGPAPERLWGTHVTLEPAAPGPDLDLTDGAWSLTSRTLDDVRVRLLTDDPEATAGILESAVLFETDHHGCASSSPVQATEFVRPEPFEVTAVGAVDSISVCQYLRGVPLGDPALMASRTMTGADATALLEGLQSAPPGGGPDRPENCTDDLDAMHGSGIALRLHHDGTSDTVFVYWDWCFGNGTDDGSTLRQLTADTCAPLFGPPVNAWSYQSNLGKVCGDS